MAKSSKHQEEIKLGIDKKDHLLGMMEKFNERRMQKSGCDLVIKAEEKEILVHRSVMMIGSDFFDAMLTHDMQEKQRGVAEIKDIPFQILKKCVEFIYTGEISVLVEECEDLLFAAGMLQLTSVCNNIAPLLERHLTISSFFATKRIADKFSLLNLKKVCDDFALKNLDEIVKEKGFNDLEKEYISFLITGIKPTDRESEESKMAMILQWIKADAGSRSQYLLDLASLVDFKKISPSYGKFLAQDEELCKSFEFMSMLYLGVINETCVEKKSAKISCKSFHPNSLLLFEQSSKALKAYDPNSKSWTQMQVLHTDMNDGYYTAVSVENFIYVLFGNKKAFRLNVIQRASWEGIPHMKKDHEIPHSAVCGDDIYVLGSLSVESFNIVERKWIEIDCAGIPNGNRSALASLHGFLYAIGGWNKGILKDTNKYSKPQHSWASVPPMPRGRCNPGSAVYKDKIFVGGGQDGDILNDFMCFDPVTNAWTQLSPMIKQHTYFSFCIISGKIYTVGSNLSCSIEIYDFEEGSWKAVSNIDDASMIAARATVAV